MAKPTLSKDLWAPRSVADTLRVYAEWAEQYDADVTGAGYATPLRLARALAGEISDKTQPVLDFGCGTGLSGAALTALDFTMVDGADISKDMLALAEAKQVYRRLWRSEPGALDIAPGDYETIVAAGVVSLGAAPPETLALLMDQLAPGGLLAWSYNDATLADASYMEALRAAVAANGALIFEEYGPHLPEKQMGSTIYILRKT